MSPTVQPPCDKNWSVNPALPMKVRTGCDRNSEGCHRASGIHADVPIRGGAYSLAVVTWWRTRNRRWAVLAALVGFLIVAVYLTVMNSEGNNDIVEVAPLDVGHALVPQLSL